ncbi:MULTISPECIES: hypothetical protein [unclassified Streptomyces]|uniref:hypothetical protein n=1 Tax=unclassified Streptomyces TaxID=2593676 RepID=UPI002E31F29F|nr:MULTISPECIES: hypothetical protein [unclassified Streptomyces]
MGERQADADLFLGRCPGPSLGALLAAARTVPVDPDAERRALAAYRAARERGAHGARPRRRDDWTDRAHVSDRTARGAVPDPTDPTDPTDGSDLDGRTDRAGLT